MAMSLPPTLVERLLLDNDFQPGCRPMHFRAVVSAEQEPLAPQPHGDGWLFKETEPQRHTRRSSEADRWRNCGGIAGARDLPGQMPTIRRRYGRLIPSTANHPLIKWCAPPVAVGGKKRTAAQRATRPTASEGFAYHEYTLLDRSKPREDGSFEDLATTAHLFHIVPVKAAISRPSRLGLPASLDLSPEEEGLVNAVLAAEEFAEKSLYLTPTTPSHQPTHRPLTDPLVAEVKTVEEIISRICSNEYQPGHRPGLLCPSVQAHWYKEPGRSRGRSRRTRRGLHCDRWKHSGGPRSAKDFLVDAVSSVAVRRRTGAIFPPGKSVAAWRYHQYTLLKRKGVAAGYSWVEDIDSPILFHLQNPGSKAALDQPSKSTQHVPTTDSSPSTPPISPRSCCSTTDLDLSITSFCVPDLDLLPELEYLSLLDEEIGELPCCPSSYHKRPRSLSGEMSANQGRQQRVAAAPIGTAQSPVITVLGVLASKTDDAFSALVQQ
eukprot:COSAG02_NODE_1006_length_15265_cov_58.666886_4_plen_491_part_00